MRVVVEVAECCDLAEADSEAPPAACVCAKTKRKYLSMVVQYVATIQEKFLTAERRRKNKKRAHKAPLFD